MWGGRFSVTIAAITLVICAVTGIVIGALAARRGGWLDELVMRTVDVLICFPDVVIALFLIAIFGTGYGTLIAALTITGWTPFARLMRGLALEINAKDYVEAAEILGSPKAYIVFRHVIPNAIRPVLAMGFLRFGHKLITVGALSYLGLGVQPPDSDWGAMLLDAQPYMERAPFLGILPGFAIFVTALSVTMIGQGLDIKKTRRKRAQAPGATRPASRPQLDVGRGTVTHEPAAALQLPRATFASMVTERLRDSIVNGTLEPGSQLSEVELAHSFGVSRGPVREAIQRLVQEGLLRSEPHRGVFVPVLTDADVADVYLARAALESAALRRLDRHLSRRRAATRSSTSTSPRWRRPRHGGTGRPSAGPTWSSTPPWWPPPAASASSGCSPR